MSIISLFLKLTFYTKRWRPCLRTDTATIYLFCNLFYTDTNICLTPINSTCNGKMRFHLSFMPSYSFIINPQQF